MTFHSFDSDLACKYGMAGAVLIQHFSFWLEKNKAHQRNINDGQVWTYASMKALTQIFPYLSQDQIKRELKKLKDAGVLICNNYNQSAYDRTLWYTFSKDFIWRNHTFHLAESPNQNGGIASPIPDNKTDIETDNPPNPPNGGKADSVPYQEIINSYKTHCPKLKEFKVLTDKRQRQIKKLWNASPIHQNVSFWDSYFAACNTDPFYQGVNERNWRADIEYLTRQEVFAKNIEKFS